MVLDASQQKMSCNVANDADPPINDFIPGVKDCRVVHNQGFSWSKLLRQAHSGLSASFATALYHISRCCQMG